MATQPITVGRSVGSGARRLATETKSAVKTTELYAFIAAVVGVLIAGNAIEGEEGGPDVFAADKVWLYITLLTIGYLLSRGLAKSGSRDPYWEGGHNEAREKDFDDKR